MADSLLDQANKALLDEVRREKPQSFTVGGSYDGKRIIGGVTYHRTWVNGWGAAAYFWAWFDDLPVSTHTPKVKAGAEITKRF